MDHKQASTDPVGTGRVAGRGPYTGDAARIWVEQVFMLLKRCQAWPPEPDESPNMRLIRRAIAAVEDAPGPPECDRRFWRVIFDAVLTDDPLGTTEA